MPKLGYKKSLSLGEDALAFTSEFIGRMRELEAVIFKPTSRQAITIPSLLSSRRIRNGLLTAQDFMLAAVVSSRPEDQAVAYQVAKEILFGEEKKEEEPENPRKQEERGGEEREESQKFEAVVTQQDRGGQGRTEDKKRQTGDSGIGGGEELFLKWWRKFLRDKEYKRRLLERSERMMMSSNSSCEYTFLTKEDIGALEGYKLRFFQPGEDTYLIDFEETIQNLADQGKELRGIRYEDFVIRERKGQRKAVVLLQDISGSMSAALQYSLVCATILLYALRKHEIALIFFETNNHLVKEFFDRKSVEETVEMMVSAQPMGGTMGANALRWARKQLLKIDGRYYERECIILSDLGFFDAQKVANEIKALTDLDAKVVVIVPPDPRLPANLQPTFLYRRWLEVISRALEAIRNKADCTIVQLDSSKVTRFLEIASEVI